MASQAVLELLVQLKDQASSGLASLGGALKTVGGAALGVGVAGFAALGAAVVSGIGDAREAAQIMAQTEAVIKSTGGAAGFTAQQISDMAASLSAASGKSLFGDSDIQKGQNLLLTFTNIKETLPDATAVMVDMAQAMGTDVSGGAIQLGKALNDPIAGISALSRVGVTFTEEQKAQIAAMQEAGDMAGAQQVILAELNKEFGGSAAAAAAADGGMAQFQDRLGEAAETMGAAFLPLLNQVVGALIEHILPAVESAATAFAAWLSDPATQQGISQIASAISDTLGPALAWLAEHVPPAIQVVIDVISTAVGIITDLFQSDLAPALEENAGFFQSTFNTIAEIVSTVVQIIQAVLTPLIGFIQAHGNEIRAILMNTWDGIKAVITGALDLIRGIVTAVLLLLKGDFSGAWDAIKTGAASFVSGLLTSIRTGLDNLKIIFGGAIDSVKRAWDGLISGAAQIGRNIIDGIVRGVKNAAGSLFDSMRDMAQGALDAAMDVLGISSPSKAFAELVGEPIIAGIAQGVKTMLPFLDGVFAQVASDMLAKAGKVTDKVRAEIARVVEDLEKQAKDIGRTVNDAMASGFGAEASIDRLIARNIEALEEVSDKARAYAQSQLNTATEMAAQFTDPARGADFLKMRSNQIFELAELQDKLNEATDAKERARIQQQIDLISKAQVAEQRAFRAESANERGPVQQLTEMLNAFLANPNLPGILDSPVVKQMQALLSELRSGTGSFAFAPATPGGMGAGGPVDSRGFTMYNTFNLPAGSDRSTVDAVIRELNKQTNSRRQ